MVTHDETTRAKEKALALGVQLWELEGDRRYVSPGRTNDDLAYEIVVQSRQGGDITCSCPGATPLGHL
jgi:hypothetical protein